MGVDGGPEDKPKSVKLELQLEESLAKKLLGPKDEAKGLTLDGTLKVLQVLAAVVALVGAWRYCGEDEAIKRAQLDVQQQQVELNRLELQSKGNYHIEIDTTMLLSPTAVAGLYALRLTMTVPNHGPVPLSLTSNVVDIYKGASAEFGNRDILPIRKPEEPTGVVNWQGNPIQHTNYIDALGGGNTGVIMPGEATSSVYDYTIRAATGDWIGVRSASYTAEVVDAGTGKSRPPWVIMQCCRLGGNDLWTCPMAERTDAGALSDGGHK
jgi:hypothetical protein